MTLGISQFEISGKDTSELQPKNILLISFMLEVVHLDISGIDVIKLHLANIPLIV